MPTRLSSFIVAPTSQDVGFFTIASSQSTALPPLEMLPDFTGQSDNALAYIAPAAPVISLPPPPAAIAVAEIALPQQNFPLPDNASFNFDGGSVAMPNDQLNYQFPNGFVDGA
jgi:hypothetical protein